MQDLKDFSVSENFQYSFYISIGDIIGLTTGNCMLPSNSIVTYVGHPTLPKAFWTWVIFLKDSPNFSQVS